MSAIRINDAFDIEGKFSFDVAYNRGTSPILTEIRGALVSSAGYLPEIRSIENERYRLDGIFVERETYGSEEDNMIYHFTAKKYAMANSLQEVKTFGR